PGAPDVHLNAQLIAWVPGGETELAQATFGPYAYTEVTAEITALQAHVREVFGDMNDDALLTQADVIQIHKMFGVVAEGSSGKGDLDADGIVGAQDASYLQWLVRVIGNKDVVIGRSLRGPGAAPQTRGHTT